MKAHPEVSTSIAARGRFWRLLGTLLVFGYAWVGQAMAQQAKPILLGAGDGNYTLRGPYVSFLADTTSSLTIEQISQPEIEGQFHISDKNNPFIERINATYWLRFQWEDTTEIPTDWLLEVIDFHTGEVVLYQPDPGGYRPEPITGARLPFATRQYPHKNFVFRLRASSPGINTCYLRIRSNSHNILIAKIRSTQFFTYYSLNEYLFLGIYYGIITIMGVYNLLLYFSVRDRLYLTYFFYVVCCVLVSLTEDGFGFQYLWPGLPVLNYWLETYSPLALMLSLFWYFIRFTRLKANLPVLHRRVRLVVAACMGYFVLNSIFFRLGTGGWPFLLLVGVLGYATIRSYRQGNKAAFYVIAGFMGLFLTLLLAILRTWGLVHFEHFSMVYAFNMAVVIDTLAFSYALSEGARAAKHEKEQAQQALVRELKLKRDQQAEQNAQLERLVEARTQQLNLTNRELEGANDLLNTQALEISRINQNLNAENVLLQDNVEELTRARVLMRDVNYLEFSRIFPDKEACLTFLSDLKWQGHYSCRKCEGHKYGKGKDEGSRRCSRCGYDESVTAFTLFHKLKFPIEKAFYMLFLLYSQGGRVSAAELAEVVALRPATCWGFKKKIDQAAANATGHPTAADTEGWSRLILVAPSILSDVP